MIKNQIFHFSKHSIFARWTLFAKDLVVPLMLSHNCQKFGANPPKMDELWPENMAQVPRVGASF